MTVYFRWFTVPIVAPISKLNMVAPLKADPPVANSTTMHSRVVNQDINLGLDRTPYLIGLAKPM